MERKRYEDACDASLSGKNQFVQNRKTLYTGKVIGCEGDKFKVDVFGHEAEWDRRNCDLADMKINPLGPKSGII